MRSVSNNPTLLLLAAVLGASIPAGVFAQDAADGGVVTVNGRLPDASEMTEGPEVVGFITARSGDRLQVTTADGTAATIAVTGDTRVRGAGGFLGLDRQPLAADALLTGLPISVKTLQWEGGLVASRIDLKDKDLKTATMIREGTGQRFAEHGAAIEQNAAATETLRGRMGDIDQYNVKRTTNVHFDVDRAALSAQAEAELCATAAEAEATDNALLLVVGYTDATGDLDYNQQLSERRAGRVVNHLQQACGWKPYRMLTPTGMAEADPLASNDTDEGKAQNRRVAVNILVSKGLDGL